MEITKTLFVLFLYLGGEPTEWTPHFTLSECLKVKRQIERNVGKQVGERYSCKEETVAITNDNPAGTYVITKFIEG
tara:strand:- start:1000 stop:1227 length:228 start_codon:yes stop_codon:yes gene_type:complete